jgi:hypothetical protein
VLGWTQATGSEWPCALGGKGAMGSVVSIFCVVQTLWEIGGGLLIAQQPLPGASFSHPVRTV